MSILVLVTRHLTLGYSYGGRTISEVLRTFGHDYLIARTGCGLVATNWPLPAFRAHTVL
jgi:hypothetical protein